MRAADAPPAALLLLLALGFGRVRLGLLADLEPLLPEVDEHLVPERRLVLVVQLPQDGLVGLQVRLELLELLDELVLVVGHLEESWSEDNTTQTKSLSRAGKNNLDRAETTYIEDQFQEKCSSKISFRQTIFLMELYQLFKNHFKKKMFFIFC